MDLRKISFDILDAIATPIFVIDCNYNIVGANKSACASYCISPDAIADYKCFKMAHKLDRPCWQDGIKCPVKIAFELKARTNIVHKHIYGDKTVFEEMIASPIFDEQGEVKFVVKELYDITELVQSKELRDHLKRDMKTLQGLLPICASCKKIRDNKGYWNQVETYIRNHSDVEFSHGICPDCAKQLYPDLVNKG